MRPTVPATIQLQRLLPAVVALTLGVRPLYGGPIEKTSPKSHAAQASDSELLAAALSSIERERRAIAKEREATEQLAKEILEALRTAGRASPESSETLRKLTGKLAAAERAHQAAQMKSETDQERIRALEQQAEKARDSEQAMAVERAEIEARTREAQVRIASLFEELNGFRNLARNWEMERADLVKEHDALRAESAAWQASANRARADLVKETLKRKELENALARLEAKPKSPPAIGPARYPKNADENATENARILREARGVLDDFPEASFHLVGHTSSEATSSLNLELSIRRARILAEFLQSGGIATSRITYEGQGESSPIADNNTEEGRILNRRVEIWVTE